MAVQLSPHTSSMELLLRYRQNPTVSLRNQLVRINVGLVRKIAHRVSRQCSEPYEDLEQIGYLGLIRAIERFNPSQGYAFSSFAVPYIRGEMLHFLRDRGSSVKVPRRWQELQKEGKRVRMELAQQLKRQPTDHEMAESLGISISEWCEIRMATANRQPMSLDAIVSQQTDSTTTLGDTLADVNERLQQGMEEDRQQIHRALNQLEEKTRIAIECVFLNDLSRKEVARRIGVSPMTVSRRIHRGLNEMGDLLQPFAPAR